MDSEPTFHVKQSKSLFRLSAEFSLLDQRCAMQRIISLRDLGFDERQISAMTGWDTVDVCRALAGRL